MTEITYDPTPPSAQHEANNAHYVLAKTVREMLPKFCKDPDKCDELLRCEPNSRPRRL